MVVISEDDELNELGQIDTAKKLAELLSYLCGQSIHDDELTEEEKYSIDQVVRRANGTERVQLSCEEFNELLLLFNQRRVTRAFFNFFFLNKEPKTGETMTVGFSDLKEGIKRFRGFAMLCFGNFRFAFRTLSKEETWNGLIERLHPWTNDSQEEERKLRSRQEPLTPLIDSGDEIDRETIWLLGYISSGALGADGNALKRVQELAVAATEAERSLEEEVAKLKQLTDELTRVNSDVTKARELGKRNTAKYLTWDFMDVYVATSMRQQWEFEDTFDFVRDLFLTELKDFRQLRWFDPTQAFSDSVPDKGLVEGLMLRRARCTIYMAQEGDTLGKDSELAATLAQGKPVIAYIPQFLGADLENLVSIISNRPVRYFRQRLLNLLADGFFDRPDNRQAVARLARELGLEMDPHKLIEKINSYLQKLMPFENSRQFKLIGTEEAEFRHLNDSWLKELSIFMAAAESQAADNRANTFKKSHPLATQVHLETGVANGVLVARSVKECADLVRGLVLRNLTFVVRALSGTGKNRIATVLEEQRTGSRFRIVTSDPCLTNSFWNFYKFTKGETLYG